MRIITATLTLIVSFILFLILPLLKHRITLRLASKRHACAYPPRLPSSDPFFNIDLVRQDLRWRKENRRVKTLYASHQDFARTYEHYPFGSRMVSTVDPRNVQFVLATQAEKFGVGPARARATVPLLGRGIISVDGKYWRKGRDLLMPVFTKSRIADREMFETHVGRLMDKLKGDGETINLAPLFDQLILDASSEFIFGESLETLRDKECPPDARDFIDAFNRAQKHTAYRFVLGKMCFLLPKGTFKEDCAAVQSFTQRHVERAVQRARSANDKSTGKGKRYNLVHEVAGETEDSAALCDQLLNVFFAGRDTPAVALSNVLFCIARHPEVWRKIREEAQGLQPEDLSFEKLKSMRYTQHAINEALRLYPALPAVSRSCLSDTVLPYGGGPDGTEPVYLLAGDTVQWSVYTMHRDPDIFGADIHAYRPERWVDIRPGWSYLPFGGGARHCPAQQLALFWVSYVIVRMAGVFRELVNRDPVDEYVENLKLNMESLNGVKVGLVSG